MHFQSYTVTRKKNELIYQYRHLNVSIEPNTVVNRHSESIGKKGTIINIVAYIPVEDERRGKTTNGEKRR